MSAGGQERVAASVQRTGGRAEEERTAGMGQPGAEGEDPGAGGGLAGSTGGGREGPRGDTHTHFDPPPVALILSNLLWTFISAPCSLILGSFLI